jgi:cobalt-zinc-cadmium efflux system membrane fusion protein
MLPTADAHPEIRIPRGSPASPLCYSTRRLFIYRSLKISFVLALGVALWLNRAWVMAQWQALRPASQTPSSIIGPNGPRVELVSEKPNTIRIPKDLLATPRFKTTPVLGTPAPEPLRLRGSVITDPNRNARVHSLFSGQFVKVGLPGNMAQDSRSMSDNPERGLRDNDEVKKGQVLAVIYSKDVGALKTDLLNQLTTLWAAQTKLERYENVEKVTPGATAPNVLTDQKQLVQAASVAVRNARRNLRASRFTEEEIRTVEQEAAKLKDNPNAAHDLELERTWAEYLVRAPFDGRILEKNVTIGDAVDPTTDLFKLSRLDRLQVLADVYEEDLPKLQQIADEAEKAEKAFAEPAGADSPGMEDVKKAAGDRARAWTISYQATGQSEMGAFDKLVAHIDPMQHTGTVKGWVNNPQRKLFVGQFVIATIKLPPDPNLVAVPTTAVIESPDGPMVFVRVDAAESHFSKRKVAVVVRGREQFFLRREPTPAEAAQGATAIGPSDVVVARGALELAGEIEALQSEGRKEPANNSETPGPERGK